MITRRSRRLAESDLSALCPYTHLLSIAGVRIVVEPCKFKDVLRLLQSAGTLLEEVSDRSIALDAERIVELMNKYPESVDSLCALSCGRDAAWSAALPDGVRTEVFGAALLANRDFFQAPPPPEPPSSDPWVVVKEWPDEPGKHLPLSEVVAVLIAAGHRWMDVREYTLPQIRLFFWHASQQQRMGI